MKGEWWALLGEGSAAILFKDKSSGHYLEREMVVADLFGEGENVTKGKCFVEMFR